MLFRSRQWVPRSGHGIHLPKEPLLLYQLPVQCQPRRSPFKYLAWLPVTCFSAHSLPWLSRLHDPRFQSYFPPLLYLGSASVQLDHFLFLECVTTRPCLGAPGSSYSSVSPSPSAETLFNDFQSSLKVQCLNLTKLCNSVMALRLPPVIVVLMTVLILCPFPAPNRQNVIPSGARPYYSFCTTALALARVQYRASPTVGTFY